MNIKREFTEPECQRLREVCNFSDEELRIFNMRVKDKSVVQISMELCMSERTVDRRLQNIKKKIYRVL